jgi:hypothetical protein
MSDTPEKIIPTNEMLVMLCADLEADGMLNSAVIRRWSAWLRRAGRAPNHDPSPRHVQRSPKPSRR